jgi:1-deoxy-D-xylulose-5-phosphate reductoisomerase
MKHIVILGSTGSIGTNTLDIVDRFPEEFRVVGLTAGTNDEKLEAQIRKFRPAFAALANEAAAAKLRERCAGLPVKILRGRRGRGPCRTVGGGRIRHFRYRRRRGTTPDAWRRFVPENRSPWPIKNPWSCAGALMQSEAKKHHVRIFPIDSEHSAIFQSLEGHRREDIKRIILTASGGPLWGFSREQLQDVSPERALQAPQLENGIQDHDRFGHADEQGTGSH